MNKTMRQVSFSIWFEEDDFSYDNKIAFTNALKKPKFSREKLHQLLDDFFK